MILFATERLFWSPILGDRLSHFRPPWATSCTLSHFKRHFKQVGPRIESNKGLKRGTLSLFSIFQGCLPLKRAFVPGTVPLPTLGSTSQQEPCNTDVPSGWYKGQGTLLWTCLWAFLGHRGGTRMAPCTVPLRNPKSTSRRARLKNPDLWSWTMTPSYSLLGNFLRTHVLAGTCITQYVLGDRFLSSTGTGKSGALRMRVPKA